MREWNWASEKHDVLIQDTSGEEVLAATFAHDERGPDRHVQHARALGRGARRDQARRRPADRAAARRGLQVIAIHPNQVAAARPRLSHQRRETRWLGRVRALRARQDRQPSLSGAGRRQRRHQGAACARSRPRGSHASACWGGQPAARRAGALRARSSRHVRRRRYRALPGSDYYGDSAPPRRRPLRTLRPACTPKRASATFRTVPRASAPERPRARTRRSRQPVRHATPPERPQR